MLIFKVLLLFGLVWNLYVLGWVKVLLKVWKLKDFLFFWKVVIKDLGWVLLFFVNVVEMWVGVFIKIFMWMLLGFVILIFLWMGLYMDLFWRRGLILILYLLGFLMMFCLWFFVWIELILILLRNSLLVLWYLWFVLFLVVMIMVYFLLVFIGLGLDGCFMVMFVFDRVCLNLFVELVLKYWFLDLLVM